MDKTKKENVFIHTIKLPFLGVYTFFKWIVLVLRYESLGCYYTAHALLYPFIILFSSLSNGVYSIYRKKEDKKINLQDIAPNESVNMDSGDEEFKPQKEEKIKKKTLDQRVQEYFKAKYDNFYFVKKAREKEELIRNDLLTELKNDTVRNEKPLTFRYTAYDADGKKVINVFLGYSKMEVFSYLENEGYKVLKIETSKWITFMYGPTNFGGYKLNNKDLIFWLTQLATYIKSGIPLTDAMRILGKQLAKNPRKKRLFDAIIYNLTLGEAFSTALEKQHGAFPPLLINMIKAAEATGELEETLDDMANYYTDIEATRKQMISAMTYPSIITIFSLAVVVFILVYVIPQFQSVYNQSGATLNGFTLFIISASSFVKTNLMQMLLIIIAIVAGIVLMYKKIKGFRYYMQYFTMHMPVVGKVIIYKEMNVFAKTFSSLLKNDVFITESIGLLSNVTTNEIYKEIMFKTINNIAKGEKISTAFKNQWAVPDVAYYMIVTGESTGELAQMMGKVADYYQVEHKAIVNSLKSFIEPAMIIFLAVVVGGIVMAIILPMFGLYTQIQ